MANRRKIIQELPKGRHVNDGSDRGREQGRTRAKGRERARERERKRERTGLLNIKSESNSIVSTSSNRCIYHLLRMWGWEYIPHSNPLQWYRRPAFSKNPSPHPRSSLSRRLPFEEVRPMGLSSCDPSKQSACQKHGWNWHGPAVPRFCSPVPLLCPGPFA